MPLTLAELKAYVTHKAVEEEEIHPVVKEWIDNNNVIHIPMYELNENERTTLAEAVSEFLESKQ